MRKILTFVKGAVSTKDLVPVLTNFHFYDGRVQGGNGRVTIDAPLDLGGVDITVPAVPFLRAVDACDGAPVLNVTKGGRLTMKKGKFRSILPLANQEDFPRAEVDLSSAALWKPEPGLLKALRTIRPLIGQDASRPWACGALFKNGYIYATNNVVMVRIPWEMPDDVCLNIPSFAIDELIRVGGDPTGFMFNESSAVFTYNQSSWIKTQLFESAWPDVDQFFQAEELETVPLGLLEAVTKVLPFCPDSKYPVITLTEEDVCTAEGDMSASVECVAGLFPGKYRAEPLLLVLQQAVTIDLTKYPAPVPFAGLNGLQGVIVGVR